MGASTVPSLLLILPAFLIAVVGLVFLKRGRWPRRVGDTPHCRQCDYILSGLEADRCPECGMLVRPGTPVLGERHRRAGLAWLGALWLTLGCAGLFLGASGGLNSIDWNRYKSLSWLLRDMDSSFSATANPAWAEVQRRMTANLISDSQQNQLVEMALQAQASAINHKYNQPLFDLITRRYRNHQLSPAQQERFFKAALNTVIEVRPVVGSLDPVFYWIWSRGRGPDGWWTRTRVLEWQVDDGKIEKGNNGSGGSSSFAGGGSGSSLKPQPPGKHHLRVRVERATRAGTSSNDDEPFDKTITTDLLAEFESVPGHAPIATVTSPEASVLQPLLSVRLSVSGSGASSYLNVAIDAQALPVDAAFDCVLRINGKEFPCGSANFRKGRAASYGTGGGELPQPLPSKVDVILRSSEAVARGTTDLTTIWKGEIVLRDVPVKLPAGSAPQPMTTK